ncbi:rhomboid family intramembrane serine protease [Calidifontibacillus oryziterrae]|uniref:rhomboid family intramembrane serine protease n=1 Tax=Calidifontibacillus oryziterrae TaxID=1191699 RepID=UPI0002FDD5F7|nr:rhomboid family intramembrane serine protease [Calidifontibacillus oryziterrae]
MLVASEQDQLYWSLVYDLVLNYDYRLLSLNENGEVWLESSNRKNGTIVRLLRYDVDWTNWLLHDIDTVKRQMNNLKKQTYRKKFRVFNIYVTTYPPVDDWEYQIEKSNSNELTTFVIEHSNRSKKLLQLFNNLQISKTDDNEWQEQQNIPQLIQSIRQEEKAKIQKEKSLLFAKKPFLTYILVAVNILMFLLLEWFGSSTDTLTLIQFGAKYNPLILSGEWWRLISPVFLHIGFFHLFMNTVALYYLGIAVERIYGTWRFFIIYFSSGILGAIVSFAFTTQVSAGASGAIFGCFGALLYFGVVHPSLFFRTMGMNVIAVLGLNLGLGFVVPMIDNGAHIGGLIGGFLASAFVHLPKHKKHTKQFVALVILCLLSSSIYGYGVKYKDQPQDPLVVGQMAGQLIEEGNDEQAYQLLSNLIQEQKQDDLPIEIIFLLSYTEIKLGFFEKAIHHLEYVVEKKPDFHEAYYNLSLVYFDQQNYDKASEAIEAALKIEPNDHQYQLLMKQIEQIN